jgi:hypothetical protein
VSIEFAFRNLGPPGDVCGTGSLEAEFEEKLRGGI